MNEAPRTYDAVEAGLICHKAPRWMKEQARNGNIPGSKLGRTWVWTAQQLSDILRSFEQAPRAVLVPRTPARRRQAAAVAPLLQARQPRRKRREQAA